MASSPELVVMLLFHTIVTLVIASNMPIQKTKYFSWSIQNNRLISFENIKKSSPCSPATLHRGHCCLQTLLSQRKQHAAHNRSQVLQANADRLTRISHKDRCERPESAVNAGLQRQKAHRHIEIFRGRFLGL
jgi:hypothetical protein